MTSVPSAPPPPTQAAPAPGPSLRVWGVLVFVFFFLTSAVGGSLALESSYLPITLGSHIGLGLVTLALAGYATSAVGRAYKSVPRASAALTALCALGAVIAGTLFLLAGQSHVALDAMEGLAGLGILGALLMIIFGGRSGRRTAQTAAS